DLMNDFQAHVIVDDLGFFLEPYFEDGLVAQKVQEALDQGIIYVSSAGNQAQVHYEGDYVDSGDGKGSHQISPGNSVFNVSNPPGSQLLVIVQWSNPFGSSADDYNLCLQAENSAQCANFNVQQNGDDDPVELAALNCGGQGGCSLQVRKVSGGAQRIELFVLGGTLNASDRVPAGSVFGHAALSGALAAAAVDASESVNAWERVPAGGCCGHAALPGALAAAAVDASDPGNDTVESYSSRGPSRIFFPSPQTRDHPDLAASDGVEVRVSGAL